MDDSELRELVRLRHREEVMRLELGRLRNVLGNIIEASYRYQQQWVIEAVKVGMGENAADLLAGERLAKHENARANDHPHQQAARVPGRDRVIRTVVTTQLSVAENLSWNSGHEPGDPMVIVPAADFGRDQQRLARAAELIDEAARESGITGSLYKRLIAWLAEDKETDDAE